ncbi:HAD family hydrolase [Metasolibacillus meyeri]|uniref:HAD family hydrolase n=1 Tax=Metasolibacillus meyeri TaxID=1071052 RepID=A0AAW9NZ40_9BACL|nr:HAD family hydrolase [Metasolibacillus meyeri]MEC1180218.1 HAD family hydrolase [Metasolibacillus meyeri]
MLLFTSDLDRTLMYSQRLLQQFPSASEMVAVEQMDGKVISYMTEELVSLLKKVCEQTLFVPVTTRSTAQYERLAFMHKLQPAYAIISNGGILLENGRPNEQWTKIMKQRIAASAVPYAEIAQHLQRMESSIWLQRSRCMDSLFVVHYVDKEAFSAAHYQELQQAVNPYGWRIWLNGRKLYMMPKVLTKEAAITYLQEHCTYNQHVAAGDSIMDYGMLALADIGYTPYHGDLKDKQPQALSNIVYSEQSGAAFTQELLEAVLRLAAK